MACYNRSPPFWLFLVGGGIFGGGGIGDVHSKLWH